MENVIPFRKGAPMISLDYKTLNSQAFNQALGQLSHEKGFSNFQAAYNVSRIIRQFEKELKQAREMYAEWVKEYTVKDEKGQAKFANPPQHPLCPFEIIPEKTEEFNKKMEEFLAVKIELKSFPIKIQDLAEIRLSPQQMIALEPILDPASLQPEASAH